jgi:hypothetical protein
MKEKEIIQAVEDYFIEMLSKDADYFDHITDSWIYDAENWFMKKYFSEIDAIGLHQFSTIAIERKNEIYDEKYGVRDAKLLLSGLMWNAKELQNAFESIKHNLKVFPTFNNVVTKDIDNLIEHLQILSDIENGKIESLN